MKLLNFALFAGTLCLAPGELSANPLGGAVTAGSATIMGQGTSTVTVNQASNTAIINWQSFSINAGELTKFVQPSNTSAVLNRVMGGETSIINGALQANGQIYLINGNGILVGPGGTIKTGAFTASTRDIANTDFLSGNLHFAGSSSAGVQNLGRIEALGGDVILIGNTVDNQGAIIAHQGTAGLVAGDDILLAQKNTDGSTITVSPTTVTHLAGGKIAVHNSGTIQAVSAELKAANGNIYALAIQNKGTIRASTVLKQGGRIWLMSDSGAVINSGTLNASAKVAGGKGGTIVLRSLTGPAVDSGNIVAKGGVVGVGGNAEISGSTLQFTGRVDLTSKNGTNGNLLLDPTMLEVLTGGGSNLAGSPIDPDAVVMALNGANVTLQADQSITVTDAIDASGNAQAGNLVLNAPTDFLNAPIMLKNGSTLSGTAMTVSVGANGFVQNGVDTVANGGTVNLAAATYALSREIVVSKSITISGQSAMSTIFNGQNQTRLIEVDGLTSSVVVSLNGLTLEHGNGAGANQSGTGGGLLILSGNGNTATVTIASSAVSGNSALLGGGIANEQGTLTIMGSTVSGNSSGSGGGILNQGLGAETAMLTIDDSTISGNSVFGNGSGGGINNAGGGGGSAVSVINQSTIAGNTTALAIGGGIENNGMAGTATLTISDTILAGNSTGFLESDYDNANATGALNDGGYNLFVESGNSGGFGGNGTTDVALITAGNLSLSSLANNGGSTQTRALLSGSPAIAAGGPNIGGQELDQRGFARTRTGPISIGAFEFNLAVNDVVPPPPTQSPVPPVGNTFTPFAGFSAQFNANAGYNTLFGQSWFSFSDSSQDGWLMPVYSLGYQPPQVYSLHGSSSAGSATPPQGAIAFGSSFGGGSNQPR